MGRDPDEWAGWDIPCDGVLRRLLPALTPGPALHVGLRAARPPALLEGAGFAMEVVTLTPGPMVEWLPGPPSRDRPTDSIGVPELTHGRYALVILDGVLSFLAPRSGDRLVAWAKCAVRAGGLVYVAAYAGSDPARALAETGAEEGAAAGLRPRRYLVAGELDMAFEGWMLLHVTYGPQLDVRGRPRSAAVLVARRPTGSALLV
jgi:hypothetical protein